MAEIVHSVRHVAQILGAISVARAKQEAGINQINSAVISLDAATQQNAALVEQAAASAAAMYQKATELAALVEHFNIGATARSNSNMAPPQPARQPTLELALKLALVASSVTGAGTEM